MAISPYLHPTHMNRFIFQIMFLVWGNLSSFQGKAKHLSSMLVSAFTRRKDLAEICYVYKGDTQIRFIFDGEIRKD